MQTCYLLLKSVVEITALGSLPSEDSAQKNLKNVQYLKKQILCMIYLFYY